MADVWYPGRLRHCVHGALRPHGLAAGRDVPDARALYGDEPALQYRHRLVGGIQPALSFAIVAATGNIYAGLWYPVGVGITAIVVALLFLKETKGRDLSAIES